MASVNKPGIRDSGKNIYQLLEEGEDEKYT